MFPAILGVLVSINLLRTEGTVVLWSLLLMRSLIRSLVKFFPKEENYALSDQVRRCAVSVPSNIAEGSGRNSPKEFVQFLYIALGSINELETQLIQGLSNDEVEAFFSIIEKMKKNME